MHLILQCMLKIYWLVQYYFKQAQPPLISYDPQEIFSFQDLFHLIGSDANAVLQLNWAFIYIIPLCPADGHF